MPLGPLRPFRLTDRKYKLQRRSDNSQRAPQANSDQEETPARVTFGRGTRGRFRGTGRGLRVRGHPGQAERHGGGQGAGHGGPFHAVCIGANALPESPPGTSRQLATGRLRGTGASARGRECLVLARVGRGRPRSSRGQQRGLWPARTPPQGTPRRVTESWCVSAAPGAPRAGQRRAAGGWGWPAARGRRARPG